MLGIGPACIRDVIGALKRRKDEDERRMKRLYSIWEHGESSDVAWAVDMYCDYYHDVCRINDYISRLEDYLEMVGDSDE